MSCGRSKQNAQEAGYVQHLVTPGIPKLLHFNAPQKHSKTKSNEPLLSDGYYEATKNSDLDLDFVWSQSGSS